METTHTKVKCCKETIYGLTFGKIYDVIEDGFMFFKIVDDNNKVAIIIKDNFWDASNEAENIALSHLSDKNLKMQTDSGLVRTGKTF